MIAIDEPYFYLPFYTFFNQYPPETKNMDTKIIFMKHQLNFNITTWMKCFIVIPSDDSCKQLISFITVDSKISYESAMYELQEKINYISIYPDTDQSLKDRLTIDLMYNLPYVTMEKALEKIV